MDVDRWSGNPADHSLLYRELFYLRTQDAEDH